MMKVKYAGLAKTFHNGYSQLAEQDFFELSQHDLEDMGLADRINIHYKIGKFENVSFNEDEQYFVNKAFRTETFQDVLELAQELYEFIKDQEEMMTKLDDLEFTFGQESSSGQGIPIQPSDSDDGIEIDGDSSEIGEGGQGDSSSMEELMEELEAASESDTNPMGGIHGGVSEAVTDKTFQENLENLNNKEKS